MNKKKALITGITGQDGSYLAEFLLDKGYEIHGLVRRSSSFNTNRISHLYLKSAIKDMHSSKAVNLHYGDMTDSTNLIRLLKEIQPTEIYNLAAQSHVQVSFQVPEYTANTDGLGTLRLLEAVRFLGMENNTKIYQASTSELFGKVQEIPQSETTPFYPRSPYAAAKLYAYWIVQNYREAYNLFAVNGILFNHESPRRGETFVTRKITLAAARIALGIQDVLYLGNMEAKRDWGYAKDYIESMYLMLQQDKPEDYVIATGETHTVKEFCDIAFNLLNIPIVWCGVGRELIAVNTLTNKIIIKTNPKYYRPCEVDILLGNPQKAVDKLNWNPKKTKFKDLVKIMVESDYKLIKRSIHDESLQIIKQQLGF